MVGGIKAVDVERLRCLMGHFLTGKGFELPAVCPGKSTVFCKPTFLSSLDHRHSLVNKGPGHEKSFVYDVVVKGISGFFFKFAHKMIFTHIISGSKLFHRQVCLQIVIDILKKAGNL